MRCSISIASRADGGCASSLTGLSDRASIDELDTIAPDIPERRDLVGRLRDRGYVEDADGRLRVVAPDIAVARGLASALQHQQDVTASMLELLEQLPALSRSWEMGASPDENAIQGEIIEGDANALRRWFAITARMTPQNPGASHPDFSFIHDHIIPNLEGMRAEFADRGYAIRYLFPASEFDDPRNREAADALLSIGAPVRVARHLPSWFYVDRGVMAGLPQVWGNTSPGAMVMAYSPSLIDAYSWLFESWWETATPYPFTARGWEPVLTLMGKGRSDEQIADALGMGLRTVRRRIAEAMDELGAPSRFELGAAWERWRDGGRID